jgi:hypothetical protein
LLLVLLLHEGLRVAEVLLHGDTFRAGVRRNGPRAPLEAVVARGRSSACQPGGSRDTLLGPL